LIANLRSKEVANVAYYGRNYGRKYGRKLAKFSVEIRNFNSFNSFLDAI